MVKTLVDFKANYKAIIHSNKLSDHKKNILLKNLLTNIEQIFFDIHEKDFSIIEQRDEAKILYQHIKDNLIAYKKK